jgi:hypothetical protein
MEPIQESNEGREAVKRYRADELTQFELLTLPENTDIKLIRNKSVEIINKNIDLTKHQKELYKTKAKLNSKYKDERKIVEIAEINSNKLKEKKEQLTKDQLEVIVKSKISESLLKEIDLNESEINQCELISKNHNLVSKQLQNYNLSDSTYRKWMHNEDVL